MIKLTFDGTKFRDDQGREVVNPEIFKQCWFGFDDIAFSDLLIGVGCTQDWPHGYEVIKKLNGATIHPRYIESIKLIHPSERANDRHEKSKQLFKEFLNSEEAKEIIGTMKDEKLTPEQGSELVEIYKKAGWHEEEANKTDMKDFKKFTTLEETPTTATNSTEAKPDPTKETPDELTMRLLPCPFCGGQPGVDVFFAGYVNVSDRHVKCIACSILMQQDRTDKVIGMWNTRHQSQPSPSEEHVLTGVDWKRACKDREQKLAASEDHIEVLKEQLEQSYEEYRLLDKKLAASESRVKELEERIEALLDNHGLTNAKIKQIAAEERVKELEALAIRLSELLQDGNNALQMDCDVGTYDFTEDNELIAKAKALKP